MNPFDQCARYAAGQLDAGGFLRWALPEVFADWRWVGWLDTQSLPFPGDPERRADTVAAFERLAGDAPPLAVVIEFQSRPRADMLERLAEYVLRLRREKPAQLQPRVPYEVIGLLFNLTGAEQPNTWTMQPGGLGGVGLRFQARVRTLRQAEAGDLLQQIALGQTARCVLPWVPLLRGADPATTVDEWKRLAGQEDDVRKRSDYAGLAQVFAELAGCAGVWRTGLEGWNVEVSQVVLEWQAKARAEGEARGRAEGEARGRVEGRAEVLQLVRSKLLQLLRVRLQAEPPADLVAAVEAQNDLDTLGRWFDQALTVGSFAEARTAFGIP